METITYQDLMKFQEINTCDNQGRPKSKVRIVREVLSVDPKARDNYSYCTLGALVASGLSLDVTGLLSIANGESFNLESIARDRRHLQRKYPTLQGVNHDKNQECDTQPTLELAPRKPLLLAIAKTPGFLATGRAEDDDGTWLKRVDGIVYLCSKSFGNFPNSDPKLAKTYAQSNYGNPVRSIIDGARKSWYRIVWADILNAMDTEPAELFDWGQDETV